MLLTKFTNSFIKNGKKEKFERLMHRSFLFLSSRYFDKSVNVFSHVFKIPAVNLLYNAIELHRPTLGSKIIFKRRALLRVPAITSSRFRYGMALR